MNGKTAKVLRKSVGLNKTTKNNPATRKMYQDVKDTYLSAPRDKRYAMKRELA